MNTATEQLQQIADAWAQSLGGKIRVRLSIAVEAGPDAAPAYTYAVIGTMGSDAAWTGVAKTPADAKTDAERRWKADGAPTSTVDVEKAKLRALCRELGLRVIDDNESDEKLIDPVRDL